MTKNKKIKNLTEKDINYTDIPRTTQSFWADAKLIKQPLKKHISIRIDQDILDWLKSQGKGYQVKINNILRSYMKHNEETPTKKD